MTDTIYNAICRAMSVPVLTERTCADCGKQYTSIFRSGTCRSCYIAKTENEEHGGGVGLDLGPTDREWKDAMLGPELR